jgi:predicted dehydrogenase
MSESTKELGVGVIGCGNISSAYFRLAPLFRGYRMLACADLNMAAAEAQAKEFGLRAHTVDDLLKQDDIDIVVNLTIPAAHFGVTKAILSAGKHAYSEKPFVLSLAEGEEIRALAAGKGLRVGSAPDTFLGGAHQQARALIDDGSVGTINSGTAMVLNHGMEHWHPNPDFFYQPGAGPVLDLGPYYVTNLINLIGPVKRIASLVTTAYASRTISSEPRKGQTVPVATPTNIHALLDFASGATVTMICSWDVWAHRHSNMELYGSGGSLYVPDPNFFGGDVISGGRNFTPVETVAPWDHPFGVPNQDHPSGAKLANYRGAGLADMARAIHEGGPHRCSLEVALHAVDVMTTCLSAGASGKWEMLSTTCERPAALGPDAARALLR